MVYAPCAQMLELLELGCSKARCRKHNLAVFLRFISRRLASMTQPVISGAQVDFTWVLEERRLAAG
jgi:hypothetical protein